MSIYSPSLATLARISSYNYTLIKYPGFYFLCLFEALNPGQQFFSHFGKVSWVLPVLSNGKEVSCSKTQHRYPGKNRTHDLAFKSLTLSQLLGFIEAKVILKCLLRQ